MKPFNLEEALAGKPVITRDGKEVKQLIQFDIKDWDCLYGVIDTDVHSWNINGKYFLNKETEYDLFMKTEKKSIWINVYNNGKETWLGCSYDTKEGALINSYGDACYIKTIEITNEK